MNPGATPTRVLVTGAYGMIGFHLRCHLKAKGAFAVVPVGRNEFGNPAALDQLMEGVDAVVHLAGVNRGPEEEVVAGNLNLAQELTASLERTKAKPYLLYSSSTHALGDSPYGKSKAQAGEILNTWAESNGAAYTEIILPHVFGEGGRPFYNSVVHTFCHQLAEGAELSLANPGGCLELLHAGRVADQIAEWILDPAPGAQRLRGTEMAVGTLAEVLGNLSQSYLAQQEFPALSSQLELDLFNCLRSFLYPDHYPVELKLHTDPRGSLFEAVRSARLGQTFFSTTVPGITRGNHYHLHKVERFLVVKGRAEIRIRKLFEEHVQVFEVNGDKPAFVDIPSLHTHEITNVGDQDLLTLFWAHEFFDPENPDTFQEEVIVDLQPSSLT